MFHAPSVASPALIFKYNPRRMDKADLLGTFVGRDQLISTLTGHLAQEEISPPRHIFLWGPRGMGKTTVLLVLAEAVKNTPALAGAYDVVQFAEEERRIANLPSFAIRALELLAAMRKDVREDLEKARLRPDEALVLLLAAGERIPGRRVLALIDNFDQLAIAATSGRGRRFKTKKPVQALEQLLTSPHFLLVATALQSPARRREFPKALLKHFSAPRELQPLSDPVTFLRRRAEQDRREGFLKRLDELVHQIEGLNRLAGGNPRLLVYLYDFLGDHPLHHMVELVERIVDDLTPMYQDIIDSRLNRGQASVLETLAVNGGVGKVKEIAKLTFQSEQTIRTFLGDLCDVGLVVASKDTSSAGQDDSSSRELVFCTYPPLFQIWYESRYLDPTESRHLIRFFSVLCERREVREILDGLPTTDSTDQYSRLTNQSSRLRTVLQEAEDLLDPEWQELKDHHIDQVLARGGTLDDALASLEHAESRMPEESPHLRRVGLMVVRSEVKLARGDLAGAEADLDAAERLLRPSDPQEARINLLLARSRFLGNKGECSSAVELAEQGVALSHALAGSSRDEVLAGALLALSSAHWRSADGRIALALAERAHGLLETRSSSRTKMTAANLIGVLKSQLGDPQGAEEWLQKAMTFSIDVGDRRREAISLSNLGDLRFIRGEYTQARDFYERSLTIDKQIGNRWGEAGTMGNLGNVFHSLGERDKAIDYHRQSLKLSREAGRRSSVTASLMNLGNIAQAQGEWEIARDRYDEALALARKTGDRHAEEACIGNLGNHHKSLGEHEKAKECFERALALAREMGHRKGELASLANLAGLHRAAGKLQLARETYEQALAIALETGSRSAEAACLGSLGSVYQDLGDYELALHHLQGALAIAQEIGHRIYQAQLLKNLGSLFHTRGDSGRSLEYHLRALRIAEELGEKGLIARTIGDLGKIWHALGDNDRALECHQDALEIEQALGNRRDELQTLRNLGRVCLSRNELRRARDYLEKALSMARELGLQREEAETLSSLGRVHAEEGDYPEARRLLQSSLSVASALRARPVEGNAWGLLGLLALRQEQLQEAVGCFGKALDVFRDLQDRSGTRTSAANLCQALLQLAASAIKERNHERARPLVAEAIALAADAGAEEVLAAVVNHLLVPCLQHSRNLALEILPLFRLFGENDQFLGLSGSLRAVEALVRSYAEDRPSELVRELGPTERSLVFLPLKDRIERPLHAQVRESLDAGRTAEATRLLEQIIERSPTDPVALVNLASLRLKQGAIDEAERLLDAVPPPRHGMPPAVFLRALIDEGRGQVDRAMEKLSSLVELAGSPMEVHEHLARLLRQEKRFDEVVESLQRWRASTSNPEEQRRLDVKIAEAHLLAGNTSMARACLPPSEPAPAETPLRLLLGLMKVILALEAGDMSAARQQAIALLEQTVALEDTQSSSLPITELTERARSFLGELEGKFVSRLALAISGQVDGLQFAAEFLDEDELRLVRERLSARGQEALQALRAGRIQTFYDLRRELAGSSVTGIVAIERSFGDLSVSQQSVAAEVIVGALQNGTSREIDTSLEALGGIYSRLATTDREHALSALLRHVASPRVEQSQREPAIQILNILYPNLGEQDRAAVKNQLVDLYAEMKSPALVEFVEEILPHLEREEKS